MRYLFVFTLAALALGHAAATSYVFTSTTTNLTIGAGVLSTLEPRLQLNITAASDWNGNMTLDIQPNSPLLSGLCTLPDGYEWANVALNISRTDGGGVGLLGYPLQLDFTWFTPNPDTDIFTRKGLDLFVCNSTAGVWTKASDFGCSNLSFTANSAMHHDITQDRYLRAYVCHTTPYAVLRKTCDSTSGLPRVCNECVENRWGCWCEISANSQWDTNNTSLSLLVLSMFFFCLATILRAFYMEIYSGATPDPALEKAGLEGCLNKLVGPFKACNRCQHDNHEGVRIISVVLYLIAVGLAAARFWLGNRARQKGNGDDTWAAWRTAGVFGVAVAWVVIATGLLRATEKRLILNLCRGDFKSITSDPNPPPNQTCCGIWSHTWATLFVVCFFAAEGACALAVLLPYFGPAWTVADSNSDLNPWWWAHLGFSLGFVAFQFIGTTVAYYSKQAEDLGAAGTLQCMHAFTSFFSWGLIVHCFAVFITAVYTGWLWPCTP